MKSWKILYLLFLLCQQRVIESHQYRILLLPGDVALDSITRMALHAIRHNPGAANNETMQSFREQLLGLETPTSSDDDMINSYGVLTLAGFKGGKLLDQINQDRAFVVISNNSSEEQDPRYVLSGVLDGHGTEGHFVAEIARHKIMKYIYQGLVKVAADNAQSEFNTRQLENELLQLMSAAMIATDAEIPSGWAHSGGATCSMVLQFQSLVSLINVGDSQSFVLSFLVDRTTGNLADDSVRVRYQTRLDKPDDVDEYQRLKEAGAEVQLATFDDDARVWYESPLTGEVSGLAMSRSLGDWGATGVVAEPTIDIFNSTNMQKEALEEYLAESGECLVEGNEASKLKGEARECGLSSLREDRYDVHLFAVSATDGVIDYVTPKEIAAQIAQSIGNGIENLWLAIEDILHKSASRWNSHFSGEYRDDMAISVAAIKTETVSSTSMGELKQHSRNTL